MTNDDYASRRQWYWDQTGHAPWLRPMTLREAAELLGITPDSLRQAIARGTLKASKRGRDWWVTEKQLKQWKGER